MIQHWFSRRASWPNRCVFPTAISGCFAGPSPETNKVSERIWFFKRGPGPILPMKIYRCQVRKSRCQVRKSSFQMEAGVTCCDSVMLYSVMCWYTSHVSHYNHTRHLSAQHTPVSEGKHLQPKWCFPHQLGRLRLARGWSGAGISTGGSISYRQ